jgi:oligopeptide transport system substrate-binding protein
MENVSNGYQVDFIRKMIDKYSRVILNLAIFLFVFILVAKAADIKTPISGPFEPDTLRINIGAEPPSLDWSKATDATSFDVVSNIMVGLSAYQKDLSCGPACASSWEIKEQGKYYCFHIKPNIYWSDGKPITAYDFQYSWRRLLDPKTAAPYAFFLYDIENAFAYNQGKLTDPEKLGFEATDAQTFVVHLYRPAAYFIYLTAFSPTYPQRQDIIERYGSRWTEPGNLICNGAFVLKQWQHEYKIELQANPYYFAGKPKLQKIKMFMIPEQSTAYALYENNQLDFIDNRSFPSSEIERCRNDLTHCQQYHELSLLRVNYLAFNVEKSPFNKIKVRQAISLAIDRQHLCRILRHGEKPISYLIPGPLLGFSAFQENSFNPSLAKKLLAEAGYPEGKNFPSVYLLYPHREDTKLLVEAIQDELKRNLHIHIELLNQEWQVYLQTLRNNSPPIYRAAWGADYPDPETFMNLLTSHNGNNNTHWSNNFYDQLVSQAACETNSHHRADLYKQADHFLCDQAVPIVPMNTAAQNMLIKPWVHGIEPNALDLQFFAQVSVGDSNCLN